MFVQQHEGQRRAIARISNAAAAAAIASRAATKANGVASIRPILAPAPSYLQAAAFAPGGGPRAYLSTL